MFGTQGAPQGAFLDRPEEHFQGFLTISVCPSNDFSTFWGRQNVIKQNLVDSGIGLLLHFLDTRIWRIRVSDFYCIFPIPESCGFGNRTFIAFSIRISDFHRVLLADSGIALLLRFPIRDWIM